MVGGRTAVAGHPIRMIGNRPRGHSSLILFETVHLPEGLVEPVRVTVQEIGTRCAGIHPEQNELDVLEVVRGTLLLVGERSECGLVGDGHDAFAEVDAGGRVYRVHGHGIFEFGYIIDAVTVDVGGVRDEVLLHPVAFPGKRSDVLAEQGRSRVAQRHGDRHLKFMVRLVPDVEHEVLVGRGLDS